MQYYQKYFDVDTELILSRIRRSLVPSQQTFYTKQAINLDEDIQEDMRQPDLYAPFWVATTLIVLIAAASNLADYLASLDTQWESDFQLVSTAAVLLYGWVSVVPIVVWSIMKSIGEAPGLVSLISLYGYSLTVYLPTSVLCIVPNELLRWCLILLSFSMSSWFLLRNVYYQLPDDQRTKGLSLLATILAVNGSLSLVLKLYFFNY